MAEFLIALAVDPVEEGRGYGSLPLHCTVVQWFKTEDVRRVISDLRMICEVICPLTLKVSSFDGTFGPGGNTPVHVVHPSTVLTGLHDACMKLVEHADGTLHNPEWCGKNYRPHITITDGRCVAVGHQVVARQLYLVEKIPLLAPYTKFIRTAVSLV